MNLFYKLSFQIICFHEKLFEIDYCYGKIHIFFLSNQRKELFSKIESKEVTIRVDLTEIFERDRVL